MARTIALLTNPEAGKSRADAVASLVAARLRDAGCAITMLVPQDSSEALALAHACVADGTETLVVVGGDGSVHTVLPALVGSDTTLGIVPMGTGNDLARYFEIPRAAPRSAADIILGGTPRRIDVAAVAGRYFLTVLAAGFDAVVSERANQMSWPRGQLRYTLATLRELRVFDPISYQLDVDGTQHQFEAMLVAVGNGESFGGGLRITHGAKMDDGLLDVVIIGPMKKRQLISTYPRLFSGAHITHPAYTRFRGRTITLAAPGITAYADGERLAPLPLTTTVVPGGIQVIGR